MCARWIVADAVENGSTNSEDEEEKEDEVSVGQLLILVP